MLKGSPIQADQLSSNEHEWHSIKGKLNTEYGNAIYNSWIKHLDFHQINGGEIVLSAPTRFIKEWNRTHYATRILDYWKRYDKNIKRIDFITRKNNKESHETKVANINQPNNTTTNGIDISGKNINVLPENIHQEALGSPLDRRYSFDSFIGGESNELALKAAKTIANSNSPITGANPLYIHGGVGLGKTHLLHSIAWHMRQQFPEKRIAYLSSEKFMFEFVRSLRNKEIMNFKEAFRSVDVLLIDDIQFIAGKESTQEEFYHTLNSILSDNKQLVIAGDRSPSDIEAFNERIRSRLGGGLVVDIQQPDYNLRLEILRSKAKLSSCNNISDGVLEFLAASISSSLRELEGALNKIIAHTSLFDREVSVNNARTILSDLLRANERSLTIHEIQKKVATYFDIKISDMTSSRRMRNIARPRQIAMYLAKQLTTRSLSEIGRKFGGKDHTTIMHGIKRIDELSKSDPEVKEDVHKITQMLQ